jgi:hypothetical protein
MAPAANLTFEGEKGAWNFMKGIIYQRITPAAVKTLTIAINHNFWSAREDDYFATALDTFAGSAHSLEELTILVKGDTLFTKENYSFAAPNAEQSQVVILGCADDELKGLVDDWNTRKSPDTLKRMRKNQSNFAKGVLEAIKNGEEPHFAYADTRLDTFLDAKFKASREGYAVKTTRDSMAEFDPELLVTEKQMIMAVLQIRGIKKVTIAGPMEEELRLEIMDTCVAVRFAIQVRHFKQPNKDRIRTTTTPRAMTLRPRTARPRARRSPPLAARNSCRSTSPTPATSYARARAIRCCACPLACSPDRTFATPARRRQRTSTSMACGGAQRRSSKTHSWDGSWSRMRADLTATSSAARTRSSAACTSRRRLSRARSGTPLRRMRRHTPFSAF